MAYCHECGSEVAQNDSFCPYCGISLQPFGAGETASENSDTNDLAEVSSPNSETKAESTQTEADSTYFELSTIAAEENKQLDDVSSETNEAEKREEKSETENMFAPETPQMEAKFDDFDNIPTPAIIENLESFENASAKNPEAAKVQTVADDTDDFGLVADDDKTFESGNSDEVFANEENNFQFQSEKSEENLIEPENEEQADTTADDTPQVENKALNSDFTDAAGASTVETLNTDTSENIPEMNFEQSQSPEVDDFSQTLPNFEPAGEKFETGDFSEPDEISAESNTDTAQENQTEPNVEDSINKPSDNLESFEPQGAASIFDSVRIMENEQIADDSTVRSDNENLIPIASEAEQKSEEKSVIQPSEPLEDEANFSQTTPNIGASDTDGKKSSKLKPLDEGIVLNNRYEIIRKIGGGGMGAVYLASDNNLGGVLRAVKEMVQSYIEESQQEKSIEDFRRESMILSTLDHNSIPTIYDYFYDEKESRFYLVMKYINGGDLSGRLRATPEGKIDEQTVTEWAIQIADVLDYLHNRPTTIVYRDLKPSNVMIDGNSGRIMLIDFGIARSVKKEEKGVTAVGTMGYAPPELFSGNVEPRSDIYSLGSTMFHLLTGADPQNNPLLIFDFQKNPRPRQINPQLSDQMERILMKAVEYNSTARFASAIEMKRALIEHLENFKANRVTFGIKEVPQSVSLENQMVFCGFCGQKIVASDMFCAFCGSKQPMSQQGVHAEIYSSNYQTARLVVLGTNDLESPMFNLEKDENFVGRRDPQSGIFPEVDLSKFDPQTKISRRHARIWRDGGNFLVEDLGSSNGTVIMPQVSDVVRLLPHQPHILGNGDKIRIGDTTLHFVKG